jgi:predicted ATPase
MSLPLPSLEINGFRTFDHLQLPRLGRANLLVGKNNSGKSSVLEAVRIYATRAARDVLLDIVESREELIFKEDRLDVQTLLTGFRQLFRGRTLDSTSAVFSIGPPGNERQQLRVSIETVERVVDNGLALSFENSVPGLMISFGGVPRSVPLDSIRRGGITRLDELVMNHSFVPPNGITPAQTIRLWDDVTLTEYEEQVVHALRIIAPGIQRLSAVGDDVSPSRRIMLARTSETRAPVPLKSMGDGMNRFLGIALSLVNAQNGILLIDEIENGIHFSVQERLWDLIFREARRLNVQVFATTHSWDCIEAFQQAARRDDGEEAALIRLDRRDGDIRPTTFNEEELSIVARQHLEVR